MVADELPLPDSAELLATLTSAEARRIYTFLYARRSDPPTMTEIEAHLQELTGSPQSQRGRRVRELYPHFQIDKTKERVPRYVLVSRSTRNITKSTAISLRIRAQVLAPQRCAMCGATPLEDDVKLVVDHKVPQKWGGTHELENLQPLCTDCNAGKKDHFEAYDQYSDQIRSAAMHDEPQKRIGELYLAFGEGEWIPSEVIEIVASAKEYQDDWQRRMRDLRYLGWDYAFRKKRESDRTRTSYKLTRSAPWPENIIAAIKAEEDRRAEKKRDS
ncbi:HNH endonuclease [Nocardia sp. NPDC050712]|uniref:HNH endonuclease n=1 Tax=Nocardia sp. NPDC050712 TaxID=3155518 RepID=UPI003411C1C9